MTEAGVTWWWLLGNQAFGIQVYDTKEIDNLCSLIKDFVYNLDIRELQVQKRFFDEEDEEDVYEEPRDRIDLKPVIMGLKNMTNLHIQFGVRNVGTNYRKVLLQFTTGDCRNIGLGVSESPSIRLLRIHNSELDDAKLGVLLNNMQGNKTLESLNFSHCRIGDEGAAAIAKYLSERSNIRNLDLCNNHIGSIGVKSLAFVLTQEPSCSLTKLSLRLNLFGDEGAKFLFSALTRQAPAIRILNISCTGLGEDSGLLLGEVISRNKSLVDLDVSNNQFGEEAGKVIQREMVNNTTLQFLDLRMTGVSKEAQLVIENLLHANRCRTRKAKNGQDDEMDDIFLP